MNDLEQKRIDEFREEILTRGWEETSDLVFEKEGLTVYLSGTNIFSEDSKGNRLISSNLPNNRKGQDSAITHLKLLGTIK